MLVTDFDLELTESYSASEKESIMPRIDNQGVYYGDLEFQPLRGQPGLGVYRLVLPIKIRFLKDDDRGFHILDLGAELMLKTRNEHRILGALRPHRSPFRPLRAVLSETTEEDLVLDLSAAHVNAVEQERNGGSLQFTVTLWVATLDADRYDTFTVQDLLSVSQGDWIRVLANMRYADVMLLEVPRPDADRRPELADAVAHLAGAQKAMVRGEYRESVGRCRDALEAIACVDGPGRNIRELVGSPRDLDKSGRLALVRQALLVLAHSARHADEVGARIDWDRADAVFMVSALAALLAHNPS